MPFPSFGPAVLLLLAAFPALAQLPTEEPLLGSFCTTPAHWSPPFVNAYHLRTGGMLVFVAVEHTKDPTSPTMAAIKTAFERYKPDVVLIEGVSADRSRDDAYRAFVAGRIREQYATGTLQENLYAAKLAADRNGFYQGWDLSPHDEYVMDIAHGVAIDDAIGAHLLRAQVDPTSSTPSPAIQNELRSVPLTRRVEKFDFAGWYRTHYDRPVDPSARTPCGEGIASPIIAFESARRTQKLIAVMNAYAKPGTTVMVEAGANHWLAMRAYLSSISVGPLQ